MSAAERQDTDVISVADLARRLKRSVEGQTGREWVEGEIVSLKRAASGHVYFSLKDQREDATLDCVMYRMDAERARQQLFNGARVQMLGRATLWVPRGRLQVVAQRIRPVGLGSALEQLEKLKKKLLAEGLFDPARKRPLPESPAVVGIVTSAHGAALHDIRTVAFRRGRVVLVLSAALVQGEGAPDSLVAAIDRIEKDPRVEVLIIGRGGGSDEDLMAFNDERVVRRLAALALPTVSAVGHEVDTTLTDLVADVRAATPSQAAELVVPELEPRLTRLRRDRRQLVRAMRTRLAEDAAHMRSLRSRLSDPRFVVAQRQQDLDDFCMRAERAMRGRVTGLSERARALRSRLLARHPRLVVMGSRSSLEPLRARLRVAVRDRTRGAEAARKVQVPALSNAMRRRLQDERNQLKSTRGRLEALSPLTVLGRGYSIVMTETGSAITEASQVHAGDPVVVRLHRGELTATVRTTSADSDGSSPRGEA